MEVRIVHAVLGTGSSTQIFSSAGGGTCIASAFFWVRSTSDGSSVGHAGLGMGASDGTRHWATHGADEDLADPSRCTQQGSEANCVVIGNASGAGVDEVGAFNAFVTDGVELEWNGGVAPTTAYRIMAVLFFDTDGAECEVGVTLNNGDALDVAHTVTLVDMTLEPEGILFGSGNANPFSSTPTNDMALCMGFGHGPTASISQACYSYTSDDARAQATRVAAEARNDHVIFKTLYGGGAGTHWELTALGDNGSRGTFQMTKRNAGATVSYGYLAFSSNGVNEIHIAAPQLDFSALGDADYTGASFQAAALLMLFGENVTVNVRDAGGKAIANGVAGIDEDEDQEGSYSFYIQEVDPANTNSLFRSQVVRCLSKVGSTVSYASTFTSFLSNGFRLNVVTANELKVVPLLLIGPPVVGAGRKRAMVCG